jgi:hypothetical protein
MVSDLGHGGYLRVGMPMAEVVWLLGQPDNSERLAGGPLVRWDTGALGSDCTYFWVQATADGKAVIHWEGQSGDVDLGS